MMRVVVLCSCVTICSSVLAQESCIPYIMEPCDGDPQQYECVKVTTYLSTDKGGESATLTQDLCFKQGSPLFGGFEEELGIEVNADMGELRLDSLKEGDQIGGFRFSVKLSDFGAECDVGDSAVLRAPMTVTKVYDNFVEVEVRVQEASDPLVQCLLTYDPMDEEHNNGLMLEGELTYGPGGKGFALFLRLAVPEGVAMFPGLEYGDLQGTGSPVPLYFDPLTKEGLYILPPQGGTLTILTALSASNEAGESVSVDFEETFQIQPGAGGTSFRRGDVNDDGAVNIADAVSLLGHLFGGEPAPVCPDAADSNDDGQLNIADAIAVLTYLFGGGSIPEPGAEACGTDPTEDTLGECRSQRC